LIKKVIVMALSCLVVYSVCGLGPTRAETAKEYLDQSKVKAKVRELGNTRVEVKLRDQTRLKGQMSSIDDDGFSITDAKSGSSQRVAYAEVLDVKKASGGVSTKTWIIIGAAGAGAIVTWLIVKPAFCDGGAQTRFPC
jgi:NAD-dependent DNA ligase